jgi:glycosyltransferase involved in cell wall biosynthesis
VIKDAIPSERLSKVLNRWSFESARNHLGINDEEVVATLVGTICARKGQTDIIQAFKYLPSGMYNKLRVFVVGHPADYEYSRSIETLMKQLPREAAGRISFIGETPDPFLYYCASDIFVCTSRIESAPRVVAEAMACGLPIITTPVYGIPEMVREGINALFYNPGDIDTLARHLSLLVDNPKLRSRFADHSLSVLGGLPTFDDMVNAYARLIQEAAMLHDVYRNRCAKPDANSSSREIFS